MKIVDANVLLYAINEDAEHHEASRTWLDDALGGSDSVGLSWIVLLAFVRLSTSPRVFRSPLSSDEAMAQVQDWIAAPTARVLSPGDRHAGILADVIAGSGATANLMNDAHIAALAVEHRCDVVSYDSDFGRFDGVRWKTPDELLAPKASR